MQESKLNDTINFSCNVIKFYFFHEKFARSIFHPILVGGEKGEEREREREEGREKKLNRGNEKEKKNAY